MQYTPYARWWLLLISNFALLQSLSIYCQYIQQECKSRFINAVHSAIENKPVEVTTVKQSLLEASDPAEFMRRVIIDKEQELLDELEQKYGIDQERLLEKMSEILDKKPRHKRDKIKVDPRLSDYLTTRIKQLMPQKFNWRNLSLQIACSKKSGLARHSHCTIILGPQFMRLAPGVQEALIAQQAFQIKHKDQAIRALIYNALEQETRDASARERQEVIAMYLKWCRFHMLRADCRTMATTHLNAQNIHQTLQYLAQLHGPPESTEHTFYSFRTQAGALACTLYDLKHQAETNKSYAFCQKATTDMPGR